MLKTILKKSTILQEYVGELKITYQNDFLEVMNYKKIISIYEKEVVLEKIIIEGDNLKIFYQDPVTIKVKGKITSVIAKMEHGI